MVASPETAFEELANKFAVALMIAQTAERALHPGFHFLIRAWQDDSHASSKKPQTFGFQHGRNGSGNDCITIIPPSEIGSSGEISEHGCRGRDLSLCASILRGVGTDDVSQ
jgi:hypothetical protein